MAAKKTYVLGSKPKLRVQFRNPATGELTDPSTVTLKVHTPSAVTTTYVYGTDPDLTKESTGTYFRRIDLNAGGTWEWTYKGVTSDDAIVVRGELLCEDPGF